MTDAIRYLQQRLNDGGFGPINVDGLWGPQTRAALDLAVPALVKTLPDVDPVLLADLRRDEGLRLTAYPDPLSPLAAATKRAGLGQMDYRRVPGWRELSGAPWTIGYGHTGSDVHEGLTWTKAQADAALARDVQAHNDVLDRVLPWVANLDPVRRRVLYNMHFNMGWDNPRTAKLEGLSGFVNTLAKIKAGDYQGAAYGMEASLWFKQTGDRAKRLVAQMRQGT